MLKGADTGKQYVIWSDFDLLFVPFDCFFITCIFFPNRTWLKQTAVVQVICISSLAKKNICYNCSRCYPGHDSAIDIPVLKQALANNGIPMVRAIY